jgi:GDP-mannose 6-dehydrogenase
MSISVFGLGYVGCVSAACFAKQGFTVIGADVVARKAELVNAGKATILEEGITELVQKMVAAGRLSATTDVRHAVTGSQISLICVGTPSRPNGSIDLTYIERVCEEIGTVISTLDRRHVVVIRSTVLPGSVDEVVVPALERTSGKKAGRDFGVAMNPEFLREGTSIRDFYDPPFTVIGAGDTETHNAVSELYRGIEAPIHTTAVRVAEAVKYACNCYHGLKVGFANEIGNVCKALEIDSHEVMRVFCDDQKLNISAAYLKPGYAFGGSCLPKDLRAITYRARSLDVETPILRAVLDSNQQQVDRAVTMVQATGARRVGVLGMAFKAGTDDLRESPIVSMIEHLIGKGLDLAIYDRDVTNANIIGTNREYIEREIPHIWSLVRPSIDEVLEHAEVLVIGNSTEEFRRLEPRLGNGQIVIDLVRAFGKRESDGETYRGICW